MSVYLHNEGQNPTALVTGATGFIGHHLCNELVSKGYRVIALLRTESNDQFLKQIDSIEVVRAEFSELEKLKDCCRDVDVVFHLASIAHVGEPDEAALESVILQGSNSIAQAAKNSNVKSFVFFSSSLVNSVDENQNSSLSNYAQFKKLAENSLLELSDKNFHVSILRPVNVYGAGMKGNVRGLINRIRFGKLPALPKLTNTLRMVSVQDLCAAALLVSRAEPSTDQIYTVCDDEKYTPNSLEAAIYGALGQKKPGWHTPRVVFFLASLGAQLANNLGLWKNDLGLRTYRNLIGQTGSSTASNERIKADLGFQPRHNFYAELPAILDSL